MSRTTRIAMLACCFAAMAVLPAVALARKTKIETSQTLKLNAYAKNISGYAGPKNTSGILPGGSLYVAEVSGTISYYARQQYSHPSGEWETVCGTPESAPGIHRPVGIDAEFIFGRPWTSPCPLETADPLDELRDQHEQWLQLRAPRSAGRPVRRTYAGTQVQLSAGRSQQIRPVPPEGPAQGRAADCRQLRESHDPRAQGDPDRLRGRRLRRLRKAQRSSLHRRYVVST